MKYFIALLMLFVLSTPLLAQNVYMPYVRFQNRPTWVPPKVPGIMWMADGSFRLTTSSAGSAYIVTSSSPGAPPISDPLVLNAVWADQFKNKAGTGPPDFPDTLRSAGETVLSSTTGVTTNTPQNISGAKSFQVPIDFTTVSSLPLPASGHATFGILSPFFLSVREPSGATHNVAFTDVGNVWTGPLQNFSGGLTWSGSISASLTDAYIDMFVGFTQPLRERLSITDISILSGNLAADMVEFNRSLTLGAFDATGAVLNVVDNTAASGPALRVTKTAGLAVDVIGNVNIDGDFGIEDLKRIYSLTGVNDFYIDGPVSIRDSAGTTQIRIGSIPSCPNGLLSQGETVLSSTTLASIGGGVTTDTAQTISGEKTFTSTIPMHAITSANPGEDFHIEGPVSIRNSAGTTAIRVTPGMFTFLPKSIAPGVFEYIAVPAGTRGFYFDRHVKISSGQLVLYSNGSAPVNIYMGASTHTEASRITMYDGGVDKPACWKMFSGEATGVPYYWWPASTGVPRYHTSEPTNEDTDGQAFALEGNDVKFNNVTANGDLDVELSLSLATHTVEPSVVSTRATFWSSADGSAQVSYNGTVKQVTTVFGTWSQDAFDSTTSTTTSETYQNKLTFTTPASLPAGDYFVTCSYFWYFTSNSNEYQAQIELDNTTQIYQHRCFPADSDTTNRFRGGGMVKVTLTTGAHTFDLDWRRVGGSGTAAIGEALLSLKRVN